MGMMKITKLTSVLRFRLFRVLIALLSMDYDQ